METSSGHVDVFKEGSVIAGRYEVVGTLGKGGVGIVAKVIDRHLNNELSAMKILFPHLADDPVQFARFRNEVILSRRLSHPNIVRVYDFGGVENGYSFITMEYVDGGSLSSRIYSQRYRPLSFPDKLRILHEILSGLSCAHSQGVVHRDLKPDNILLTDMDKVKISDFGLARSLMVDNGFTNTGETVGTPYYMSPEQLRGKKVDARTDLYSTGILAFELIAGRRPYFHEDYFTLARMHLMDPLPTLPQGNPEWCQEWLDKLTAKSPEKRFGSAKEASLALEQFMHDRNNESVKRIPAVLSLYSQRAMKNTSKKSVLKKVMFTLCFAALFAGLISLIRTKDNLRTGVGSYLISNSSSSVGALQALIGETSTSGDIFLAARLGNEKLVNSLLFSGVDSSLKDKTGSTILHHAVIGGNENIVKALIDAEADLNKPNSKGLSPLSLAAKQGMVSIIDLLIDAGASTASREGDLTPLIYAVKNNQIQAAQKLLYRGGSSSTKDKKGRTALFYAIETKSIPLVQKLLDTGANPNVIDVEGNTPLIQAVKLHDESMIRLVIGTGKVDIRHKNQEGKSAKAYATKNEQALLQTGVIMSVGGKSIKTAKEKRFSRLRKVANNSSAQSFSANGATTGQAVKKSSLKTMKPKSSFKNVNGYNLVEISAEVKNTTPEQAQNVVVTATLKSGKKIKLEGPSSLGRFESKIYTHQSQALKLDQVQRVKVSTKCSNCY